MAAISDDEKQRRRQINASVVGTHVMEGLPPDAATRVLLHRYEEGELTGEELSAALHAHALALVEEAQTVTAA